MLYCQMNRKQLFKLYAKQIMKLLLFAYWKQRLHPFQTATQFENGAHEHHLFDSLQAVLSTQEPELVQFVLDVVGSMSHECSLEL